MGVIRMRMSQHVVDDLVKPIMLEIVATAKAAGVALPDDVVDKQIRLDPADEGDFLPSMGQDAVKVRYLTPEVVLNAN
jgi:ketopantoate reductase